MPVRHAENASQSALPVPPVHGELETHITVVCPAAGLDRLAIWAARRSLGFAHIVLARGRVVSQPMLSLRGRGGAAAQVRRATAIAADLTADGFPVVRLKTEASPWSSGVPQDDSDTDRDAPVYFEHHVKLLLPVGHERKAVEDLAAPHGAHVSWNARRVHDDGQQERFVTQRCHRVGRATAEHRLADLLDDLRSHAFHILEVEREFVLLDTDLSMDDGWIPEESSR